jgi:hypothetical protein
MITLAILSALPMIAMGEIGTLVASRGADDYVVCGERRTAPQGPELVNRDDEVVVPVLYELEVERQMRQPAKDGATYCVTFRREMGLVRPMGISQLSCSGLPRTWSPKPASGVADRF